MIIHKVKEGECLRDVARLYNTAPYQLAENNGLCESDPLIVGEELIVPFPTRTYTVRRGDTLSGIARRFGVKKQELLSINPYLLGKEEIFPTQPIAIKYQRENLGMAAANGFMNSDCPNDVFYRVLPYLVYVTLCGAVTDGKKVYPPKHSREIAVEISSRGKLPLLRIYDKSLGEYLNSSEERSRLCNSIIAAAESDGYSGVVIASENIGKEKFLEFLLELRKRMLGSSLILLTEGAYDKLESTATLTDGNILIHSKIDGDVSLAFNSCEAEILQSFAERSESSKTFVDLSAHAYGGGKFIPITKARADCISRGGYVTTDEKSLVSSYVCQGRSPVYFESLSNIKAKLQKIGELGYMGICVDIANVPVSHLVMYHMTFSPIYHTLNYSDL